MRWEATNWNGACDELARIAKSTLVITGTDDNADMPHEDSLIIAANSKKSEDLSSNRLEHAQYNTVVPS